MGKNKDEHRTLNSHACLTRWGLFEIFIIIMGQVVVYS